MRVFEFRYEHPRESSLIRGKIYLLWVADTTPRADREAIRPDHPKGPRRNNRIVPRAKRRFARSVCFSAAVLRDIGTARACVAIRFDSKVSKRGKLAKIAGPFQESFACLPRLGAFEMRWDWAARANRQPSP